MFAETCSAPPGQTSALRSSMQRSCTIPTRSTTTACPDPAPIMRSSSCRDRRWRRRFRLWVPCRWRRSLCMDSPTCRESSRSRWPSLPATTWTSSPTAQASSPSFRTASCSASTWQLVVALDSRITTRRLILALRTLSASASRGMRSTSASASSPSPVTSEIVPAESMRESSTLWRTMAQSGSRSRSRIALASSLKLPSLTSWSTVVTCTAG
mmetsp:Transcript_75650/g.180761  ORF Transcript_75650/g.180761 Transcript_75650/m.180761 type:complete len:212 (+) Transcript_75650:1593-2228(+)